MPRRAKEEAKKTRTRILASALDLFAKKGYTHTTFTDVADRLGLTKGAVYWHFESKEALLLALVDEMLAKFGRQIDRLMPKDELTFPAVAEMMVANSREIIEDPRGTAFFLLMHEQIQWSSDTMGGVRAKILTDGRLGPLNAFQHAVANDVAAGRVRADVLPASIAHTCVAIWDGLVHAHIAKFLTLDLAATMRAAFASVWQGIRNINLKTKRIAKE